MRAQVSLPVALGGGWLWVALWRQLAQVLGFAFGHRDQDTLALCWQDVPKDYQDKSVLTDALQTYRSFFWEEQHRPAQKGSGETSLVESLNTKWPQRQPGLVRRSCGVSRRIQDDLIECLCLLIEQHNDECQRRWERDRQTTQSGQ